jgi:hypothetical protein
MSLPEDVPQEPNEPVSLGLDTTVLQAEVLIKRAFVQDPDAGMALLFRHYYGLLCSHAVRYVSSKAIAEDLVSDIFYEFHSQHLYQHVNSSYRAYLFMAVRNRAFNYVKAEIRRSTSLENAAAISTRTCPTNGGKYMSCTDSRAKNTKKLPQNCSSLSTP